MRRYAFSHYKPIVYIQPGRGCGKTMLQLEQMIALIDAGYDVRVVNKETIKNEPKEGLKIPFSFIDKDIIRF